MSIQPNRGGRPRDPAISQALFEAAEQAIETEGFSNLTVDGLVKRVGATRPAFYRRYGSLPELVFEIIRQRFEHHSLPQTGALHSDLLAWQRRDVAMMTSDLARRNFPGLLEAMSTDPSLADLYRTHFIIPRRQGVGQMIDAAVERGEIPPVGTELEYFSDLLFGPLLTRLLLPIGLPIDDNLARATVDTVLRELRAMTATPS